MSDTTNWLGMALLSHMMNRFIRKGTLHVIDADGKHHAFQGTSEPLATIQFHDPSLPLKLFRNPELHAGEAYMNGITSVDCSLTDFLGLFSINRGSMASYPMQNVLRKISRMLRCFSAMQPGRESTAERYPSL